MLWLSIFLKCSTGLQKYVSNPETKQRFGIATIR